MGLVPGLVKGLVVTVALETVVANVRLRVQHAVRIVQLEESAAH